MRKTKIICTIGPATESFDMLGQLALVAVAAVSGTLAARPRLGVWSLLSVRNDVLGEISWTP